MEVQDTRDSRRELQAVQEAITQQNLIMQRLERNLRRLEESYGRVTARLDAVEAAPTTSDPDKTSSVEKARPGHLARSGGQSKHTSREPSNSSESKATPEALPPGQSSEVPADEAGPRSGLTVRAKSALRGAILDGSINTTLDKVQATLKHADEATGAISQISTMVRTSLEGTADIQQSAPLIPGGSLALLLELAKTPQFQRFMANIVAQFLKEAGLDQALSPGRS